MVKEIPIGKNKTVLVSEIDFERASMFRWNVRHPGYAERMARDKTYTVNKTRRRTVSLHRYILGLIDEKGNKICTCGYHVDHIDHDKLNNTRENLRICFPWQNYKNVLKKRIPCSSEYLGVAFDKNRNKWTATLSDKNKTINLGRFTLEIDAAKAYNVAAKKYHGEFANLNKI